MEIPDFLMSQVREGKVVLLLGAGASIGATNSAAEPPPTSKQLAELLAKKYLGGFHRDNSLAVVAELAISESDFPTVQNYIREIFDDFKPASFHRLLPTFKWSAIATTNFDLVVERTYESAPNRAQDLVPLIKNGDRIEDKLHSPRSLMYLKLHGCITRTTDTTLPLILTVDQYITHRQGRERVFDHLKILSYEHPVVFVGHSLQDSDIRQWLLELGNIEQRPRFYTVTPKPSEQEKRFWESRRITSLEGNFQDFLESLDRKIPSPFRGIVIVPTLQLPIARRFVVRDPGLSRHCEEFLASDVDYVHRDTPMQTIEPTLFYRGYNGGWSAIDQRLDVRRKLVDTILSDIILRDDSSGLPRCPLYAVKGHAGSGKSVILRRIAWEAAVEFDKVCFFLRPNGRLSFDALREIFQVTKQTIFLFIDKAAETSFDIAALVKKGRRAGLPLVIIVAERFNEWNMSCDDLNTYTTEEFEVRYLSSKEIEELLVLLDRYNSLGTLQKASPEERTTALQERAGRQLLVALHEATLGKPFEDIIVDEYEQIKPDLAQLIYLGVCFLNRFDVPVRAGIIARIHGVRFTEFEQKFFKPLEQIVLSRYDSRIHDYLYRARHPHIAEIVFERILQSPSERLDVYLRMIKALNIDYHADRVAYRRLVRARSLVETFSDHSMIQAIYEVCGSAVGDDAYLYHQMAIYEINRVNGNLQKAGMNLKRAQELAPWDQSVIHSFAELELRNAENARSDIEFDSAEKPLI